MLFRSTNATGTNLNFAGVGSITTLSGTTLTYPTAYHTVGIITNLSGTNISYTGVSTLSGVNINSGIITSSNPGVTTVVYYGDGSKLIGVNAFNVINQTLSSSPVYPTFANNVGVTSIGIDTSNVVYIPSTGRIGIGTTNPQATLQVGTGVTVYGTTGIVSAVAFYGDGSNLRGVNAFNVINQSLTATPVYPTFANNIGVSSVGIASTGFVYIPTTARVGIATTNPQFQLDVVGDINSSTAIKVGGKNILDEALRLSIAFG